MWKRFWQRLKVSMRVHMILCSVSTGLLGKEVTSGLIRMWIFSAAASFGST